MNLELNIYIISFIDQLNNNLYCSSVCVFVKVYNKHAKNKRDKKYKRKWFFRGTGNIYREIVRRKRNILYLIYTKHTYIYDLQLKKRIYTCACGYLDEKREEGDIFFCVRDIFSIYSLSSFG